MRRLFVRVVVIPTWLFGGFTHVSCYPTCACVWQSVVCVCQVTRMRVGNECVAHGQYQAHA